MQIYYTPLNFNAKNPNIKKADKALRIINAHFPIASSTKFVKFSTAKKNKKNCDVIRTMVTTIKLLRFNFIGAELNGKPFKFYTKFIKSLKKHKMGNCGELVKLFNFILGLNGLKAEKALLAPSELNHCVSIIPLKKGAINDDIFKTTPMCKLKDVLIADPWLDVVGTPMEIANLYKNNINYKKFIGDLKTALNIDEFFSSEVLDDIYLHPIIGSQYPVDNKMRSVFQKTNPELFF